MLLQMALFHSSFNGWVVVCMYHIFFTHSSVSGHLNCFYVLAIVNSAALGCMCIFELWFCLDLCPGVGLLDHMVALVLVFWGISMLFSIVVVSVYIPTDCVGGYPFLPTLSSICYLWLFNDGHSNQWSSLHLTGWNPYSGRKSCIHLMLSFKVIHSTHAY